MAKDLLQELRRALYSGDALAMVDAVEANGLETRLQLTGELILLAVRYGASGATELAGRAIAVLRSRGWDGDDELADAMRDAVRGNDPHELDELAVDLEELADLLEGGPDSAGGRIDLTTGEVWPDRRGMDRQARRPRCRRPRTVACRPATGVGICISRHGGVRRDT